MLDITPQNIRMWSLLGSCGAFGAAAEAVVQENPDIIMLTADLCSFAGLSRFAQTYKDNFYNVGIAEQNMVGIAGGLAKEGFIPFVTTYATFASMRSLDQIKVNMGYMKLPIKLVGMTAGLSVGILGATHISIEDISAIRAIPNICILSPADTLETVKCVEAAAKTDYPVYLRLSGTMNNPPVYRNDYDFEIGKSITLKKGGDLTIIATGTMVHNALKAAKILEENGIAAEVINMHTIKPLDEQAVQKACNSKLIVTVEEHSVIGGLGAAVAEVLAKTDKKPKQLIIGISDNYMAAGDYTYLLEQYGLLPEQIAEKIEKEYKGE